MPKPGFRTAEFLWGYLIFSTAFTTNVNSSLTNSNLLVMKHKLYSLSLKML